MYARIVQPFGTRRSCLIHVSVSRIEYLLSVSQATAIKESTKSAFRFKMDVTLHAPLIVVPYKMEVTEGEIYIDLGNFRVCNDIVRGSDIMGTMETMSIWAGKATLDCINVKSSCIQIYRYVCLYTCINLNP